MSFFSYLLTATATSIVLGTVACAQNLDTISHSKKAPQNTQTQSKKQGQDFNKINFTGSYLAARAARINFDFDNAQKNAENSFVLTSMKDPYLAEQAIRLSLIQQDLDSAVELANQHIKQLKLKDTTEIKEPIGVFSVLTLLVDRMKCNEPKQALALFEQLQISFNKPMRALIGGSIYRLNGDVKKAELIEANLSGFDLFDMMRIYHAANNAYMVGDHDKALTLFEKSGKYTDALAVRSLLSAVQIYLKKGYAQNKRGV